MKIEIKAVQVKRGLGWFNMLTLALVLVSCTQVAAPAPVEPAQEEAAPAKPTAAAPATEAPAATEEAPVKLVIGVHSDISTLDIHNEPTTNFSQLQQSTEGLFQFDSKLQLQPGLALSWKLVDPLTWEFSLRKGVKFHNGDDFTAKDVKWSLERIMAVGAESGPRKGYVGWLGAIEVIDAHTVRILTSIPFPAAVRNLATYRFVLSQNYFEKVGATEFAENPVGTGPYKVVSWNVNETLELDAFTDYWGGKPAIDKVVFRVIPDESTRVAEMLAGGVDILPDVPPTRAQELLTAGVPVFSTPSVLNFYVGMNTFEKPFDDPKVRLAVAHAVDVNEIVKALLSGYGTAANSIVHSTSFGWNSALQPFPYDPAKAKQLLAEAGFPNGFSTTIEAGTGVWPITRETAEALGGYLSAVGIKADVKVYEWANYFAMYREKKLLGVHLWGNLSPGLDPDAHVHLNFRCPPTGRGLYFCSEETDKLIISGRSEMDVAKRQQIYGELQDVFQKNIGAVPLWQYHQVAAVSKRLKWLPKGDFYIDAFAVEIANP